jgi:hypothetical protein
MWGFGNVLQNPAKAGSYLVVAANYLHISTVITDVKVTYGEID